MLKYAILGLDMRANGLDLSNIPGASPGEIMAMVGRRARARRLQLNLSQGELAARAGLTLSTVRRVESGANVGFDAIVSLAIALRLESDVAALFAPRDAMPATLDELLNEPTPRRRASRKAKAAR